MKLKWGILGPGKIAHKFADDLQLNKDQHVIQSVASRSIDRAKSFSEKFQCPSYYGDYQSLLNDPYVDIVYIATPHQAHKVWALKAIQAGKHVLCEKPMTVHAKDTKEIIRMAQQHNSFVMEALWSRFNPTINKVLVHVRNGDIGELRYIHADFAFPAAYEPEGRLYNPSLAGGATLDIGIYPIFLSYLLLGNPTTLDVHAKFAESGVDEQVNCKFSYPTAEASLYWGLNSHSPMHATISGTEGSIIIHGRWHESESYTLHGHTDETFHIPHQGHGYSYEIQECYNAISNHQKESTLWTWQNSIDLAELMDEIRSRIGLRYPFE